jgi:hypothetical protein
MVEHQRIGVGEEVVGVGGGNRGIGGAEPMGGHPRDRSGVGGAAFAGSGGQDEDDIARGGARPRAEISLRSPGPQVCADLVE